MRSALLLSALIIADAVKVSDSTHDLNTNRFLAYALIIFFVMDLIEVFKKKE